MTVAQVKNRRALATTALITGIIGAVLAWVPILGLILGILAIIFGVIALKSSARGRAIAGLVLGIIGTFFSLITVVTLFSYLHVTGSIMGDNATKNNAGIVKSAVYRYSTSHDDQLPKTSDDIIPYLSEKIPSFTTVTRDYVGTPIQPQPGEVIIIRNARCTSDAQGTTVRQDARATYVLVVRLPSGGLYCP